MRVRCASVPRRQYLHRTRARFLQASWHHLGEESDLRPNEYLQQSLPYSAGAGFILFAHARGFVLRVLISRSKFDLRRIQFGF